MDPDLFAKSLNKAHRKYSKRRIAWLCTLPSLSSKILLLAERRAELVFTHHFASSILLPLFPIPPESAFRVSFFVSTIMVPQLNAAQHILIQTLLNEGLGTKLIATEACLMQRARRPENPSEETAVRNAHPKNKPRRLS
jgi:hypothetical protein